MQNKQPNLHYLLISMILKAKYNPVQFRPLSLVKLPLAPWRVLVLYKSARCARRDKHTPAPQTNEKEKSKAERSRSRPLSRLGVHPRSRSAAFWIDFVFARLLERRRVGLSALASSPSVFV